MTTPIPPQSFVVGSSWPLWGDTAFSELQIQRLAAKNGFKPWIEEKKSKKIKEVTFGCSTQLSAGWCSFSVVVTHNLSIPETLTTSINLTHNHSPPSTEEKKKKTDEALSRAQNLKAELLECAEQELSTLHERSIFRASSTMEEGGYRMSPEDEQKLIIWNVAMGISEDAAREIEQWMRDEAKVADGYPVDSVLNSPPPFHFGYPPTLTPPVTPSTPFVAPLKHSSSKILSKNSKTSVVKLDSSTFTAPSTSTSPLRSTPLPSVQTTWPSIESFYAYLSAFASSPSRTFEIDSSSLPSGSQATVSCVSNAHCPCIYTVELQDGGDYMLVRSRSVFAHNHNVARIGGNGSNLEQSQGETSVGSNKKRKIESNSSLPSTALSVSFFDRSQVSASTSAQRYHPNPLTANETPSSEEVSNAQYEAFMRTLDEMCPTSMESTAPTVEQRQPSNPLPSQILTSSQSFSPFNSSASPQVFSPSDSTLTQRPFISDPFTPSIHHSDTSPLPAPFAPPLLRRRQDFPFATLSNVVEQVDTPAITPSHPAHSTSRLDEHSPSPVDSDKAKTTHSNSNVQVVDVASTPASASLNRATADEAQTLNLTVSLSSSSRSRSTTSSSQPIASLPSSPHSPLSSFLSSLDNTHIFDFSHLEDTFVDEKLDTPRKLIDCASSYPEAWTQFVGTLNLSNVEKIVFTKSLMRLVHEGNTSNSQPLTSLASTPHSSLTTFLSTLDNTHIFDFSHLEDTFLNQKLDTPDKIIRFASGYSEDFAQFVDTLDLRNLEKIVFKTLLVRLVYEGKTAGRI